LPLTIAGGSLIFLLVAWNIPNAAASIVGGAVSLNLSHAFNAAAMGGMVSVEFSAVRRLALPSPPSHPIHR
jgi:hypothetical protein